MPEEKSEYLKWEEKQGYWENYSPWAPVPESIAKVEGEFLRTGKHPPPPFDPADA